MTKAKGDLISLVVTAPLGLHARPAIKLSRLAKSFSARLRVRAEGAEDWVDARSVVRLMSLKIAEGGRLELSASGDDSGEAIAQVSALVARNFEDVFEDKAVDG